ncbi:hypothetical protein ACSQ67_008505 [Phaseolus vulgaris]
MNPKNLLSAFSNATVLRIWPLRENLIHAVSSVSLEPYVKLKSQGRGLVGFSFDDVHDSSWSPSHIGDGFAASVRQFDGAKSSDGTGHITRLASIDSFYSK